MKVAIQGIKGSYHHEVTHQLYGDVDLVECDTFDKLCQAVVNGTVHKGVMAIGNSIAGSILNNYALIDEYGLFITAERHWDINHQLMAINGQQVDDLKEVQSHPMALRQCTQFFRDYPHIKLVETDDTAAAAKRIAENGSAGIGAIASSTAASLYGLQIIASDIQDARQNATRFVVVEKEQTNNPNSNKATINFTSSHEPGSLSTILKIYGDQQINLSKIQSIPIIDKPFLFSFVAELEFESLLQFQKAEKLVLPYLKDYKILGLYKKDAI